MKFKIFIPALKRNQPAFKIPFGYGFSYRAVNSFGDYYHIFPFNYLVRVWQRLLVRVTMWYIKRKRHVKKKKA